MMTVIAPRMRLDIVGREIARAALYLLTARAGRRGTLAPAKKQRERQKRALHSTAPTLERFRHGQIIEAYDGAVVEAGLRGHRVVDACLLDRLRERGIFGRGENALLRHSSGVWLRGLFHDSGAERSITMRLQFFHNGGDPSYASVLEKSHAASRAYALYQAALEMVAAIAGPRAADAAREIACWDKVPAGCDVARIRAAFDALAEAMDAVGGVGEEG